MKLTTFSTLLVITMPAIWAQDTVPATPILPQNQKAPAIEKGSKATEDTAKGKIDALVSGYEAQWNEFKKKVMAEPSQDKRRELSRTSRPKPGPVVDSILAIAKENPKAEGVEKGLTWSLRYVNPSQRKVISSLMLTHYKDSKALGALARSYAGWNGDEKGLRSIIEQAGDASVRQGATYYLAGLLVRDNGRKQEGLDMYKKLVATPGLEKSNPRLFAQLNGKITSIEKLAIGCTAPDIVGTDHEGKEFKLSDYRGKAVLVDFWGIW